MGILQVREVGPRRSRHSLDRLSREYTRVFQVIMDDPEDEELQVITEAQANGLPLPGDWYNVLPYGDEGALVVDYDSDQSDPDHPDVWNITVVYRSQTVDPDAAQGGATIAGQPPAPSGGGTPGAPQNTNPLQQRPVVQWGDRTVLRPILRDLGDSSASPPVASRPIANSAGTPFETQMEEVHCDVMTFTRNELKYRPWTMRPFKGSINSHTFQARPKLTVLCENITAAYAFSDGVGYFAVTYTFVFGPEDDPNFWELNLIDKGPRYRETANGALKPVPDTMGVSSGEIFLNNVDGQKHSGYDANWVLASGSVPNIRRFYTRRRKNFTELQIIDPAWI